MNFDRITIDPSKYDLQAVAEHEIDEVLGLGSGLNLPTNFPTRCPGPRISSGTAPPAFVSFTTSAHRDDLIFPFDGGVTALVGFNQDGGGDYGDWMSLGTVKVQDAFGTPGSIPTYGVEARNLDVIGYDSVAPEPGTVLLTVAGVGLLCLQSRRRRA